MSKYDRLWKSVFRYFCVFSCFIFCLTVNGCSPEESRTPPADISSPNVDNSIGGEADENAQNPDATAGQPGAEGVTPQPKTDETPQPTPDAPTFSPALDTSEPVTDEFFKNAAFIGNSLLDGLRLHSGITTGDFYAYTSMTVMGVEVKRVVNTGGGTPVTILDGLAEKEYEKLYVLFGINEIYLDTDDFIGYYSKLIDKMKVIQPNADIYIMSLTPLSKDKSEENQFYNLDHLLAFNDELYKLAQEKSCYYLDIYSALANEDGFLPKEMSTDGVHLTPGDYKAWLEFIRTHYAQPEDIIPPEEEFVSVGNMTVE